MKNLKLSNQCCGCGNAAAGFYHVKCALRMSESNAKGRLRIIADYKTENTEMLKEIEKLRVIIEEGLYLMHRYTRTEEIMELKRKAEKALEYL